jgi:hypothetical protein
MEELDQSSLLPLKRHAKTEKSQPGIGPWPPASQAGTQQDPLNVTGNRKKIRLMNAMSNVLI